MIRWNGLCICKRSATVSYARKTVRVEPQVAKVGFYLLASTERGVHPDALIEPLWGSREDGGPEVPSRIVYLCMMKLRRALACIDAPFAVYGRYGRGLVISYVERRQHAA